MITLLTQRVDYYVLEYLMTLIILKTTFITIILQYPLTALQPIIRDLGQVMLILGHYIKLNSLQKTQLTCSISLGQLISWLNQYLSTSQELTSILLSQILIQPSSLEVVCLIVW